MSGFNIIYLKYYYTTIPPPFANSNDSRHTFNNKLFAFI